MYEAGLNIPTLVHDSEALFHKPYGVQFSSSVFSKTATYSSSI